MKFLPGCVTPVLFPLLLLLIKRKNTDNPNRNHKLILKARLELSEGKCLEY